MVEFEEISFEELYSVIYQAFVGDEELIEKYGKVRGDLGLLVDYTMEQIGKAPPSENLRFYAVYINDFPAGFTVLGHHVLYSFGINIHFRKREWLTEWMDIIKEMLDNEFVTWLWPQNTRAIDFLVKQGMEHHNDNAGYVTLIYC